jgi:hypothetical protein
MFGMIRSMFRSVLFYIYTATDHAQTRYRSCVATATEHAKRRYRFCVGEVATATDPAWGRYRSCVACPESLDSRHAL